MDCVVLLHSYILGALVSEATKEMLQYYARNLWFRWRCVLDQTEFNLSPKYPSCSPHR